MMPPSPAESLRPKALPPDPPIAETVSAPASSSPPSRPDHSGRQVADFRFLRRLGEGGMGQVYLAEQLSLQRRVAIKVLRPDFAENATFVKRFETEAKAVAQLTHPNIVQVYSVGNDQGIRFMALEYVDGMNLKDYLNKKGPPEMSIALVIMRQIAAALIKAAEFGIIHRDIKPENILVTRKVEIKVADFGLSRVIGDDVHLTQTGTTMGTPLYMSPEQIMGKTLDPRTDLYSYGATCYHLLAGHPPFMADSAMAVGVRHISDPPEPLQEIRPDLPAELCQLVHRLLAKKPEDRPQTAREVLREIRRIQDLSAGSATQPMSHQLSGADDADPLDFGAASTGSSPEATAPVTLKKERRWLWPIIGVSLGTALLAGGLLGLWLRGSGTPTANPSASQPKQPTSASGVSTKTSPQKKMPNPAFVELEKKLLQTIQETKSIRDPEKPLDFPIEKMQEGLRARAKLMLQYILDLDEDTMQKTKQFAEQEMKSLLEPYRAVGFIGMGAILAHEGMTRESYDHLERAFQGRQLPRRRQILIQLSNNKDLVDLFVTTVAQNETRMPLPETLKEVKEELEKVRKRDANEKNRPSKPGSKE